MESGKRGENSGGRLEIHQTGLLDVEFDSLVVCASRLNIKQLLNLALSCKHLREVAYSDPVWRIQCRNKWPPKNSTSGLFEFSGGRKEYISRLVASQQFKFTDPVEWSIPLSLLMIRHLLVDEDTVYAAQGSCISAITTVENNKFAEVTLRDHNARINCMRLFSAGCLGASRVSLVGSDKVLVTCSADHTIRLWGKNRSLRTLRGHAGIVTVIADKLLGGSILATGGMDSTVRLWSLSGSHRKRSPLQSTLHGHESYIKELVVPGHNSSLLVSAAKDSKIRVWDVNTSECVGAVRGTDRLLNLRCSGPICYVSGGSSVAAVDLRSMSIAKNVAIHPGGITAAAISPSGWHLCTGGKDRTAKLWDVRKFSENKQPVVELSGHSGAVRCLHIDSSRIITGGLDDTSVHVWDPRDEGSLVNSLEHEMGVSALACQDARIAVATFSENTPVSDVSFRDFSNCSVSVDKPDEPGSSKFWAS